jgi:hypothetical protein
VHYGDGREQYKAYMEKWSSVLGRFDRANPSHRLLLAQTIIKAAELSNIAQKFDESEQVEAADRRGLAQGRIGLALGLPVSPTCDPNDDTPLCVGQVGF